MRMTQVPSGSGSRPGWVIPDEDVGNEDVDVLSLAGQPVPDGGAWLWVTTAEARRAGELTALVLPRERPVASGGDVLVRVAPRPGGEAGSLAVQVWAVMAGSLIRVAAWDPISAASWPEVIRDAVVFAAGALQELQDHGADVGLRDEVDVLAAAGSVPTAFPSLPVQVSPA
jgi:hypothetical protein